MLRRKKAVLPSNEAGAVVPCESRASCRPSRTVEETTAFRGALAFTLKAEKAPSRLCSRTTGTFTAG
jgi:hypothetical protein